MDHADIVHQQILSARPPLKPVADVTGICVYIMHKPGDQI
jgi:hypothetical protein